jgi:septal ring factor EnvC (AmiA/AmiB activator)
MTPSRCIQMSTGARWLVAIALCAVTGVGAAQGVSTAQQDAGSRYAKLLGEADIAARYNSTLDAQLQSQQNEIASLQAQIAGLDATAAEVPAMLQKMFDDLAAFVAADVPFLAKERADRVSRLRELMGAADKSAGEKFRRLIEAYTIEMEYGRTMEAYHATLTDGREADFVRLGRVTLMYKTAEGDEVGYWDQQKKAWVPAPEYKRSIEQALRIAKQTVAPDLITVPVPAPQGGKS